MDEGPRGSAMPLYVHVLDVAGIGPGTGVLDLGCGAGGFSGVAAARGARVLGVDVDPSAVEAAAVEVPDATFAVADAHDLAGLDLGPVAPVDVAAAVQLVAHLADPVAALREAARLAPLVAVTVWGREAECDVRGFGEALERWLGPRRTPAGPAPVTEPGRLLEIAGAAGLRVVTSDQVVCPFHYDDEDGLMVPLFGSAVGRHAINRAGPVAVREAVLERFAGNRGADGSYRLDNVFRVLTAVPA